MSANSKIEWTDATWNPVTGCTKISEGCQNCYAERIANRFWDHPFSEVRFHADRITEPNKWQKPRRVFVCSMGDLFHPDIEDWMIEEVWSIMRMNPRHTFMVLTKRPDRMQKWMYHLKFSEDAPAPNVWVGVTAEQQKEANYRITRLIEASNIAVRFISVEPMLEDMILIQYLDKLDWVICGAESGPGARPFKMSWARDLKNQCVQEGVPFFFKQARIDGKLVKMPELDGQVWDQYPEAK